MGEDVDGPFIIAPNNRAPPGFWRPIQQGAHRRRRCHPAAAGRLGAHGERAHEQEESRDGDEEDDRQPEPAEDAVADQRPKLDDYETCLFLVMKMLSVTDRQDIIVEQVSLILGRNFVLSFQENGTDVFTPVRDRLRGGKGRLRQSGADYLLYALVDAIVDQYFAVLEVLGEKIEALQDLVVSDPKPETLRQIHSLKRQLLFLRRAVWPLREATNNLSRSECPFLQESTKVFFRDVYDHVVQIVDTIETLREMVSSSLDIYLSSISYRLNAVMKVLTIITTIFMPLTFIVGIYGMNFEHMPELKWEWGYPLVLGLMVAIAIAMLGFFKRKKWI